VLLDTTAVQYLSTNGGWNEGDACVQRIPVEATLRTSLTTSAAATFSGDMKIEIF